MDFTIFDSVISYQPVVFFATYLIYFFVLPFLYFVWKKDWRTIFQILLSIAMVVGIEKILKAVFYFPRPFELNQIPPLVSASGSSFPSGHTMLAFAISTVTLLRLRQSLSAYRLISLSVLLLLVSFLIGFARVLANVHFWRDILAGASLGILVAVLVEMAVEKMVKLLRK